MVPGLKLATGKPGSSVLRHCGSCVRDSTGISRTCEDFGVQVNEVLQDEIASPERSTFKVQNPSLENCAPVETAVQSPTEPNFTTIEPPKQQTQIPKAPVT